VTGPGGFVRAHTRLVAVPFVPEIRLLLADEALALWEQTEAELDRLGMPLPFWAFPWAGGQGLARYVLDHPAMVAGGRVLDLAAGSGLVAIAAALAGAAVVTAAEVDPFAVAAIGLNAAANGVAVEAHLGDLLDDGADGFEVVLAGDVFYEGPMAARMLAYLRAAAAGGALVLVGDPGRTYLPAADLTAVAGYDVPVSRALEGADVRRTTIWRPRPS
jgi:predicted nicotinamide N-methyase